MSKIISILLLIAIASVSVAQENDELIDSLCRVYRTTDDNKVKAVCCARIASESYAPDSVIKYAQTALSISGGLDLNDMAKCYSYLGWGYFIKRNFPASSEKYQQGAALFERIGKPEEAAMLYINIAACHRYTSNYKEMWDYLYRGLDKACQACDTPNICYAYSEIADVFQNQKMGNIAQETLLKALKLAQQTGNYAEMGVYAKQLGSIVSPEDTDVEGVKKAKSWAMLAEEYFSKAEPLDHYYMAIRYNNYAELIYCNLSLAKFYYDDRYIDSTLKYVQLYDEFASDITTVADDRITCLHIHARQLIFEQKYRQAIKLLKECIKIADEENCHYLSNITFGLLAESYEKIGDFKNASFYFKKFSDVELSLSDVDAVAQTAAYKARERVDEEKRKIETENALAQQRKEEEEVRQKHTLRLIISAIIVAVTVALIMFYFWYAARKDVKNIAIRNAQIMKQQVMIDDQKRELQDTTDKIHQSMSYASRIQLAATSSEEELEAVFPGSIVVYKPQEIVSGDWYLVSQTEHQRIVAVGGSSEHGVPGAMACMLVVDSLKENISKISVDGNVSPREILSQVEAKAKSTLGTGVEIAISLCIIDDDGEMKFAAINNDAVVMHGGKPNSIIVHKREDAVMPIVSGDYLFLYSKNTRHIMTYDGNTPEKFCASLTSQTADSLLSEIETIAGSHMQLGDLTIVGVKI